MNRRCIALLAVLGLACWANTAAAQGGASIPPEARRATSVDAVAGYQSAIVQYVQGQVARLGEENAKTRSAGRDALLAEGQSADATDAYRTAYAAVVGEQITPAVADPRLQTRLNAAIVVGRLAQRTPSPVLKAQAIQLMNDPDPAVALWGLKAATAMLPLLVSTSADSSDPLIAAIVPVVQKQELGAMADEAYQALALTAPVPGTTAPLPLQQYGAVAPKVVPALLDLMDWRVQQYQQSLPSDVTAENRGTLFLATQQTWAALSPELRSRAVNTLSELLIALDTRYAAVTPDQRTSLAAVINQTGRAVYVLAGFQGATAVAEAATPLTRFSPITTPEAVSQATQALVAAIRSSPAMTSSGR